MKLSEMCTEALIAAFEVLDDDPTKGCQTCPADRDRMISTYILQDRILHELKFHFLFPEPRRQYPEFYRRWIVDEREDPDDAGDPFC